ncbi:DUF1090 domain-containing protein [Brenneria roseae subsp. roseae]|nr:DUF1090 domain-containing protein [Brenneria roseae subsp. roseae]
MCCVCHYPRLTSPRCKWLNPLHSGSKNLRRYNPNWGNDLKIRVLGIALLCGTFGISLANAESIPGGCLQKEQEIQRQIDHARQYENAPRVAGLQRALAEVKAHCTDEGLAAERREKIAEQRQKVAERKQELSESRQKGDAEKVLVREKKLAEAEQELRELEEN